jgi:DNA repair protein RadC
MERQSNFLDILESSPEALEQTKLREWASQNLDLEKLRNPSLDIRAALRYDSDKLPEEIHLMIAMLEVLLTPAPNEQIKSPHDLARLFQLKVGFRQQEELWVVSVNTKNCIQGMDMIYKGSVDSAMVRVMEVLAPPIRYNSPAMFWLHCHPSGNVEPSPEDLAIHRRIVEAAKLLDCDVLDGMIFGQGAWLSFREKGYF